MQHTSNSLGTNFTLSSSYGCYFLLFTLLRSLKIQHIVRSEIHVNFALYHLLVHPSPNLTILHLDVPIDQSILHNCVWLHLVSYLIKHLFVIYILAFLQNHESLSLLGDKNLKDLNGRHYQARAMYDQKLKERQTKIMPH